MSFAEELRAELIALPQKKPCCRTSATAGFLFSATFSGKNEVTLRLKSKEVADYALALLAGQYGQNSSLCESGRCGHRYYDLTIASHACAKRLQNLIENGVEHYSCDGCKSAFLRSVFLTAGTVSDPHKSFHLEFSMPHERAKTFMEYLTELGYSPKCVDRPSGSGVYFKDGASIEDLILQMGSHHAIYDLMNTRIERDIRNNENRATNCVAKNIERYVSASKKQLDAIEFLMRKGLFEQLDPSLQITAKLRYDNPDATLAELSELHAPTVSKSGVNHRLQRILEEAEKNGGGRL